MGTILRVPTRRNDIRRIAITCSCATRSVAEIPIQVADVKSAHLCPNPKCKKVHFFQLVKGIWTHESEEMGPDDAMFLKNS